MGSGRRSRQVGCACWELPEVTMSRGHSRRLPQLALFPHCPSSLEVVTNAHGESVVELGSNGIEQWGAEIAILHAQTCQ